MRTLGHHYARLGLRSGASKEELASAYRAAALKYHPDKGGDSATFAAIQESYQAILSHSCPPLYEPSSMRTYYHSRAGDWSDLWGIMGAVVLPTAVGLGVGIRLMYTGGEQTGLRAGGTSRFLPDNSLNPPSSVSYVEPLTRQPKQNDEQL